MTIIFEPSLKNTIKIMGDIVVINSNAPEKLAQNTYYVDANKIARDINLVIAGWAVVNTILVGAIAKVTGLFSFDSLDNAIKSYFPEKYVQINSNAAKKGFDEVKKIE